MAKQEGAPENIEKQNLWVEIEPEKDEKALTKQIISLNRTLNRTVDSVGMTIKGTKKRIEGEEKKKYWEWLQGQLDELVRKRDEIINTPKQAPVPEPTPTPEVASKTEENTEDSDSTRMGEELGDTAELEALRQQGSPDETQIGTEVVEDEPGMWRGNWAEGNRPDGWKNNTERIAKLEKAYAFSIDEVLNLQEEKRMYELLDKAQKRGVLSPEEAKELTDLNNRITDAMDLLENDPDQTSPGMNDVTAVTNESAVGTETRSRPEKRDPISGQKIRRGIPIKGYEAEVQKNPEELSDAEKVDQAKNFDELDKAIWFIKDINGQTGRLIVQKMHGILDLHEASINMNRDEEIMTLIDSLPEELGIRQKFIDLFHASSSMNGEKVIDPEKEKAEVSSTFNLRETISQNNKFADFLSEEGVNNDKAMEDPAYAEKLFKAFQVRESVTEGLKSIIEDELSQKLEKGYSIEDPKIKEKILTSINKRAIEDPESVMNMQEKLEEFKALEGRRVAAESVLKGVNNSEFAKQLETLRAKQDKLSVVERFGKFWTLRSPILNDFLYKWGLTQWGGYKFIERGGVMKEIAETKKEMGMKRLRDRLKPRFGSVGKHVRAELEKTTKEVESMSSVEGIQKLLTESKGKYDQLRKSIMEGVGINAAIHEIAIEKVGEQFQNIINPKTETEKTSLEFYQNGQKLLDAFVNNPSASMINLDFKQLQETIDKGIESIIMMNIAKNVRELGEKGSSKIPELDAVIDSLLLKEKLGSQGKKEIREFLITYLKRLFDKVKDSGTGKIRKVYLGARIADLEKAKA